MKKIYLILPFTFTFLLNSLTAQFSFTNRNDLLSNADFHSGVAIGVVDMNGDGLDDIVRMNQGYELTIEYQVPGNQMFSTYLFGNIDSGSQWSMCIADIDNNGYNDVAAGGAYDDVKLVTANTDGSAFTMSYLPGPGMFVQGSNFADINNDGYVDYFACHDDAESRIWGNDGNGNLIQQDNWIDMSTNPPSDNSGNYGSIWTDFDNDGDIDLYIAKCRQGVTDQNDPRRINALFVNDGQGNYTEMADEYGLKIGWQSWTADFQDIDNDGDLDCFITNHDYESQLLVNDGTGHFTDITAQSGINVTGLPIQGVMRDFDNDGFVDVLVAGSTAQLFHNNGNNTFTEVSGLFDNNNMESYALGDLNNDGFIDIYGGYANIYTSPSNIDDVVWMNDGGTNNYLAVNLQGTISNRNAIGSRIEIYGDWGIQVREVRSGESYGIMNSMIQYFGLGEATSVDSVVVRWTSGLVQTETNIAINSKVQILEGGCLTSATVDITASGPLVFCSGENVTLTAPAGFSTYEWSNGATTSSIEVDYTGSFNVTVTDGDGCFGFSSALATTVDPVLSPQIEVDGDLVFCEGESVTLNAINTPNAISYEWSNGATGTSLIVTESGMYHVEAYSGCDHFTSTSVEVEMLPGADTPTGVGDTIFQPGSAVLTAVGNDLAWYDVDAGGVPIGYGEEFTTPTIDVTTAFYVEDRSIYPGQLESTGAPEHTGNSQYSGNQNSNNLLIFDAWDSFILDSVKVYTDLEGSRMMVLFDANDNPIDSAEFYAEVGESMVHIGMTIPAGEDMYLSTDEDFNWNNLGIGGPRLQRSSSEVTYPYEVENVVSIKNSNWGEQWYYYFYDWKIKTPDIACAGERIPVIAMVDGTDAVEDFGKTGAVTLAPNPTNGMVNLQIHFDFQNILELQVTDLTGKTVLNKNLNADKNVELDLGHLTKGMYLIQLIDGEKVYTGKVIVQ